MGVMTDTHKTHLKIYLVRLLIMLPTQKRCHHCHKTKELSEFFITKKGLINTFKCKQCYKDEFRKILREEVLC